MRRLRTAKAVASRIDLTYFKRGHVLRRTRWMLTLLLVLVAVAGWGAYYKLDNQAIYNPGPVASAHAQFENRCEVCHEGDKKDGLFKFQQVTDNACLKCHDAAIHSDKQLTLIAEVTTPVAKMEPKGEAGDAKETKPAEGSEEHKPGGSPAESEARPTASVGHFRSAKCTECHIEHRGHEALLGTSDIHCTQCHADLAKHTNGTPLADPHVTAFTAKAHPWFGRELAKGEVAKGSSEGPPQLVDPTVLKFNHARHMDQEGIKHNCAICHTPDPVNSLAEPLTAETSSAPPWFPDAAPGSASLGVSAVQEYMRPVNYTQHCSGCHGLQISPTSGPLPHGRIELARAVVMAQTPEQLQKWLAPKPSSGTKSANDVALDNVKKFLNVIENEQRKNEVKLALASLKEQLTAPPPKPVSAPPVTTPTKEVPKATEAPKEQPKATTPGGAPPPPRRGAPPPPPRKPSSMGTPDGWLLEQVLLLAAPPPPRRPGAAAVRHTGGADSNPSPVTPATPPAAGTPPASPAANVPATPAAVRASFTAVWAPDPSIVRFVANYLVDQQCTKCHGVKETKSLARMMEPGYKNEKTSGVVEFRQIEGGVHVRADVDGLSPGKHGFHIHTDPIKDGDLKKAGDHWNPSNQEHGAPDSPQHHWGDMGNLVVDKKGHGTLDMDLPGVSLTGKDSLTGHSLIIHAKEDDLKTQPAGDSGDRIAGGVIDPPLLDTVPTGFTPSPRRWYVHSHFDHHPHRNVSCTECHSRAETSKDTSDVLVPNLSWTTAAGAAKSCMDCHHASTATDRGARADRQTCHVYHDRSREGPPNKVTSIDEIISWTKSGMKTGKPAKSPATQPAGENPAASAR